MRNLVISQWAVPLEGRKALMFLVALQIKTIIRYLNLIFFLQFVFGEGVSDDDGEDDELISKQKS